MRGTSAKLRFHRPSPRPRRHQMPNQHQHQHQRCDCQRCCCCCRRRHHRRQAFVQQYRSQRGRPGTLQVSASPVGPTFARPPRLGHYQQQQQGGDVATKQWVLQQQQQQQGRCRCQLRREQTRHWPAMLARRVLPRQLQSSGWLGGSSGTYQYNMV